MAAGGFVVKDIAEKLLILETKGIHLKGGEDTGYKKNLLTTLEEAYSTALERGRMKAGEPSVTLQAYSSARANLIAVRPRDTLVG